ncbi:hypothetical protein Tco_0800603 [Tanacetum coccineum]|uniref:Uncharacterized protein n=1 Tax=Tanacetum coccineum TaxID=301880 RepID=A0ABQ4ZUK1_9ASTR
MKELARELDAKIGGLCVLQTVSIDESAPLAQACNNALTFVRMESSMDIIAEWASCVVLRHGAVAHVVEDLGRPCGEDGRMGMNGPYRGEEEADPEEDPKKGRATVSCPMIIKVSMIPSVSQLEELTRNVIFDEVTVWIKGKGSKEFCVKVEDQVLRKRKEEKVEMKKVRNRVDKNERVHGRAERGHRLGWYDMDERSNDAIDVLKTYGITQPPGLLGPSKFLRNYSSFEIRLGASRTRGSRRVYGKADADRVAPAIRGSREKPEPSSSNTEGIPSLVACSLRHL